MLGTHAMEDIQYPALEVGDNQVYPGQELVGVLGGTLNAELVVVAQGSQAPVGWQPVVPYGACREPRLPGPPGPRQKLLVLSRTCMWARENPPVALRLTRTVTGVFPFVLPLHWRCDRWCAGCLA